MKFYSTNSKKFPVSLKQAVMMATAKDNGLFMPTKILPLPKKFFATIEKESFQEIGLEVANSLFKGSISRKDLKQIIEKSINFKCPLKKISNEKGAEIYTLELFHGPTLAFKDFGARFMAQLMSKFLKNSKQKLHILAATSGDTGSAVGKAFYNMPNIKVSLLYPGKMVSRIQEQQLTTIGKNIQAFEVKGNFDDCQKLVKTAFADQDLRKKLKTKNISLSSANSINIARLLPQSFYYFYAYAQLKKLHPDIKNSKIIISVPSGNLGNLTAGIIAKKMGLPITQFIAATNQNNSFTEFLKTGNYKPKNTIPTISNAMDVGNPNNFVRIQSLYGNKINEIKKDISSSSFTDIETKRAIKEIYEKNNYIMDPHGAVAYLGLKDYIKNNSSQKMIGIFLETAHPAKFADIVEAILKRKVELPTKLKNCLKKKKTAKKISTNYEVFERLLP